MVDGSRPEICQATELARNVGGFKDVRRWDANFPTEFYNKRPSRTKRPSFRSRRVVVRREEGKKYV